MTATNGNGELEPPPPDGAGDAGNGRDDDFSGLVNLARYRPCREPFRLLDTQTVARMLAVSEKWVREHAAELGAIRVGDGPKGAWRLDGARLRAALDRHRIDRRAYACARVSQTEPRRLLRPA